MVSHGNTCCAVRLFAAHYGDVVGESVCHPFCTAVWSVGGNLYVGGSQFPGKESAETYHRVAEWHTVGGLRLFRFDCHRTFFAAVVFDLPVGESGLAGSIVLAIMALPTIITVTEDAMRNCPRAMREASLALGASQWQTIYKVVIPYSISGITSGVVLGIGRAVGETMAVLMVTGNAAVIPHTILEPLRTIPATIAAELGEAPAGGPHYQALFLLGVVLFFISLLINFTVEAVSPKD